MNKQDIINELAYLIEINPANLTLHTPLKTFDCWDSLAVVSMIAMLEQSYGVLVDGNELIKCKTLTDIFSLAQDKQKKVA